MADENIIGLAMQLDVTDLKSGIKEVNNIIKSSKDEFSNATAGMDKWTKSSEGLNAKLSQLGKQLDAQEKAVAGYEAEIKRVSESEGDHSEQLANLNKKLQKAQAEVKKTQGQMSHYSDTLKDVQRTEKEENSTLGKLTKTISDQKKELGDLTKDYKDAVLTYGKNSKEAKNLADKIKNLSGEIEDNERKIKNADKAFDGLNKSLADVGQQAAEKAVKGLAKVGTAVGGLVTAFLATAEGTREFRTNMGKVDTAFKDAGFSAKDAEETYKKFFGVLGDEGQATEATALLGELANDQKDLKKWTDISTGVFAKFGDSLPVEGLIEASNETAKTGEIVGGLADALNWAGISQDDFQKKLDKCSNEQERQKLITETLSKTYGEASNAYKETNKDIIASQEAQAQLSQAMADIGAKAEPLMTQMKLLGTKILEAFLPVLEKIIPFVEEHLPLVIGIVGGLVGAIGTLSATIAILKIRTELATVATIAKTAAEKVAAGTTKELTLAQKALNLVMKANPIGIVITLITALVAAFVVLWKKSDSFRNFWKGLWDGIKNVTKSVTEAIAKFFSKCWDGIKKAWSGAGKFFSGVWNGIKKVFSPVVKFYADIYGKAWEGVKKVWSKATSFFSDIKDKIVNAFKNLPNGLKQFFSDAWNGIKLLWKDPKQFFTNVKDNILGAFKDLPSKLKEVGTNLVEGLWNGIKDMVGWITGKLKGFSGDVLGGIKKFFKVSSPSKATEEIGGYLAEGLAIGIEEGAEDVIAAGENIGSGFVEGFNNAAGESVNLEDTFDKLTGTIDKQKEKLSKLENQYKSAVLTFGESSTQANKLGIEIITLSREIEANELKVKNLDDSYKGLSGTLANQMRIELNNAKNSKAAIEEQIKLTRDLQAQAGKSGDLAGVKKYGEQLLDLNAQLSTTKITVDELTANLDYMSKVEKEKAANAKKTTEKVVEQKNAYQKLLETIDNQKVQLELLKTQYESAAMVLGANSSEASNLATKISVLTEELKANEKQVDELNKSYDNLFTGDESVVPDTRKGWQKWIDNLENALGVSDKKLDEWANGVGKYIDKIAGYFENLTNYISDLFGSIGSIFDTKVSKKIEQLDNEIEKLKSTNKEEIALAQATSNEQLQNIDKMYDNEQLSAEEYRDKKKQIEDEIAEYTEKKNNEAAAQEKKLLAEKDRLARKQFEAQQAQAVATAIIDGASAIVKNYAQLGLVGGSIASVTQAGLTAAQIAAIKAEKYVPMLAKGGVVNSATLAMIGENGKEAVMPLERNTGWISQLAEKLNDVMKKDMLSGVRGMQPAYAMAGGASVINNNYYQTINSPKALTRREIYRDSKNLLALKG